MEGPAASSGDVEAMVGDVIFFGIGVGSFALLALYVYGCGKA